MNQVLTLDTPPTETIASDDPAYLRGPVLRAVLPILALLLIVLAGVLTLAAFGVAITRVATLLAVGGFAALTVAGVVLRRTRRPASSRRSIGGRNAVGGLLTAAVLVGAVAVAQAVQPTAGERFVSLLTTSSATYNDGVVIAAPGQQVELGWQLLAYGVELTGDPVVSVTVDSVAPADLRSTADAAPAPEGTGFTSGLGGRVAFTAPSRPGSHQVVIVVSVPADPEGSQSLVLQLKVAS